MKVPQKIKNITTIGSNNFIQGGLIVKYLITCKAQALTNEYRKWPLLKGCAFAEDWLDYK